MKEIEALSMLPRTDARQSEIDSLKRRIESIRSELYQHLTPWQRVQLSRHPLRPQTSDYIGQCCADFVPLSGDRTLAIMVFDDGVVENRLIRQPAGVTPSALQEASNFLNARMRGRTLGETKADLRGELQLL